ncbi:MAG: hypothetical protein LBI27_09855, partial [Clostridiales bacterium]|nr:hypothetical protein [Clostridiales bacterium]
TVYEADNEWYTPSANALSADEAAEVGARYIWDGFGDSIDGKFVSLFYSHHPSGTRAYWCGMVADSADAFANDRSLYWFTVCAISGEGIDIGQFLVGDRESSLEIRELMMQGVISQEPVIDDTQLELSAKIASEYAQRHFSNSTVVSVELQRATPNAIDRDSDGNVFVTDYFLTFSITDSTGREAEVSILMESEQLGWIMTQHNDIIPGYNYDAPGGIG